MHVFDAKMYVFDTSSGMIFDKTKGLLWYGFLQIGFFFGFILSVSMVLVGPPSFSSDPQLYEIFSEYVILYKIAGIVQGVCALMLLITTIKYQYSMLRWFRIQTILVLVWYAISYLFLSLQYGVQIDLPQFIAELIGVLLSYIINYPYLKKRWFCSFSESPDAPRPPVQTPNHASPLPRSSHFLSKDLRKTDPSSLPPVNDAAIRFCRFCGNPLRDDSIYCDKCGKKVRS